MEHWKNTELDNLTQEIGSVVYIEEWRPIKDFEFYMVSSFGRIKSLPKLKVRSSRSGSFITKERIIKQNVANTGYLFFSICHTNGKIFTKHTHRIVAQEFIPNPENKPEVNHNKGIKTHNMVHQLEWNTKSENQKHAYRIGLKSKEGEKHHNAKLTEDKVLEIRGLVKLGRGNKELTKLYNVSAQTICDVSIRRTWKHI
jgi:hypothetical protein